MPIATQDDLTLLDNFLDYKIAQASGSIDQTDIVLRRVEQFQALQVGDTLPYALAQYLNEAKATLS